MWQLLIELGIIGLDYAYHRWMVQQPVPAGPSNRIQLPTTQIGAPVQLIYGRVRVNQPVLVWTGPGDVFNPNAIAGTYSSPYFYGLDQAYVLGIGFRAVPGGGGLVAPAADLHAMWAGQTPMPINAESFPPFSTTLYNAGPIAPGTPGTDAGYVSVGFVELFNGDPSQSLFDVHGTPQSYFGVRLAARSLFGANSPAYRNYILAFMFGSAATTVAAYNASLGNLGSWNLGPDPSVPSYAFEISSYTNSPLYSVAPSFGKIGMDANPVDVLYDLLVAPFGKCNLPSSAIDTASFTACAQTVFNEANGFSRVWDQQMAASDMIREILAQIDGTLYYDETQDLIGLRLIRPDFDPNALLEINPSNCREITGFTLGGWTDIPNRVQVNFNNRETGYQPDVATGASQGNYYGQQSLVRVANVNMPGVCDPDNADTLADRETLAQSRPLARCSAYVSRDFLRLRLGDAIYLTWPEAGISQMVMRVAAIDKGTLSKNEIRLDLLQDYFYNFKKQPPVQLTGVTLG
jgi:hypothetical protein